MSGFWNKLFQVGFTIVELLMGIFQAIVINSKANPTIMDMFITFPWITGALLFVTGIITGLWKDKTFITIGCVMGLTIFMTIVLGHRGVETSHQIINLLMFFNVWTWIIGGFIEVFRSK
jgi:hypothetical protein